MKHKSLFALLLFTLAMATVYLFYIDRIGYQNDDWYLMYAAQSHGVKSFADIYSVDRPARALVLTPAYQLFGGNVLYYNLSALIFRLAAALCFGWILQRMWTRSHAANLLAALLFFVYPGFLSQFNGIDYQSQMVSLAAAMFSIALSLKAYSESKVLVKILLFTPAVLLGWLYLGLVEYFLGFELFRLAIFIVLKKHTGQTRLTGLVVGIRAWLPNLLIPVIFLTWRMFFFESERGATDIGSQLSVFTDSPLTTVVWWLVRLLLNSLHVTFSAWVIPLYQLSGEVTRLREAFLVVLASAVLIVCTLWQVNYFGKVDDQEQRPSTWRTEAFWLGVVIVVAGLIPVILVNRAVDFANFTRYALASSAGSALILTALLFLIPSAGMRTLGISLLLFIATFTQHANALKIANETVSLREFWWQVAWRVPQIDRDTALIANYPVGSIQEDYFVWGPANLIYYPDGVSDDQIRVGVPAIVLNKRTQLEILAESPPAYDNRRSIRTIVNYQKILILSKPSTGSCVQIIDGSHPVFSEFEEERIMLIAPYSNIRNILLDTPVAAPSELIFGPEPVHDWCYFYEKAELARQLGDWEQVVTLGEDVFKEDLIPMDPIEWMPFLQAYAQGGNVDRLVEIKRHMRRANPFVFRQVCEKLNSIQQVNEETLRAIDTYYCAE